ncbi:MAG: efflux RND transporter periplasmic adaptor subunit, partial [Bacteroidota bacterium]
MMKYFVFVLSILLYACGVERDHGHSHNADGSHPGEEDGIPGVSLTRWSDSTELFVEFPVLVVGKTSRFTAHFTKLEDYKPVNSGTLTVSLIRDKSGIRHSVEAPARPGIFTPALQPKSSGVFKLVFDLKSRDLVEQFVIPEVAVYNSKEEAISQDSSDEAEGINFLKEQAWKIDFETKEVIEGSVYDVIHTSGKWMETPNTYKSLVATFSGVLLYENANLTEGAEVKEGQLLATISSEGLTSNNLNSQLATAESRFRQAQKEYDRKTKLYESRIIPKSQLEVIE